MIKINTTDTSDVGTVDTDRVNLTSYTSRAFLGHQSQLKETVVTQKTSGCWFPNNRSNPVSWQRSIEVWLHPTGPGYSSDICFPLVYKHPGLEACSLPILTQPRICWVCPVMGIHIWHNHSGLGLWCEPEMTVMESFQCVSCYSTLIIPQASGELSPGFQKKWSLSFSVAAWATVFHSPHAAGVLPSSRASGENTDVLSSWWPPK